MVNNTIFKYYFLKCRHNNIVVVDATSRETANTALPAKDATTIIQRVPIMSCIDLLATCIVYSVQIVYK